MSLDRELFCENLSKRLQSAWGWSPVLADATAAMALAALQDTHGGVRHHIPARKLDTDLIKREYKAGISIPNLARRYARTQRHISRIVNGR